MTQSIQEDMHKLYANTMPFYITDLSIRGFWYLPRSWNQSPWDAEGRLYIHVNQLFFHRERWMQDACQWLKGNGAGVFLPYSLRKWAVRIGIHRKLY